MIKCNVTVCGIINYSAVVRESKTVISFNFWRFVPLEGKDGTGAELQIHVSAEGDGGTKSQYSTGRHVLINGKLMVRASERGNYTIFVLKT